MVGIHLQDTHRIKRLFATSTLGREVLPLQESEELNGLSKFKHVAGK